MPGKEKNLCVTFPDATRCCLSCVFGRHCPNILPIPELNLLLVVSLARQVVEYVPHALSQCRRIRHEP